MLPFHTINSVEGAGCVLDSVVNAFDNNDAPPGTGPSRLNMDNAFAHINNPTASPLTFVFTATTSTPGGNSKLGCCGFSIYRNSNTSWSLAIKCCSRIHGMRLLRVLHRRYSPALHLLPISECCGRHSGDHVARGVDDLSNAKGSFNSAAHFCHSDLRSAAQFVIQPSLDWPSPLNR